MLGFANGGIVQEDGLIVADLGCDLTGCTTDIACPLLSGSQCLVREVVNWFFGESCGCKDCG